MIKSRMKSGARRESIITAAIRLFSEKGFRGTTTRELAGMLDVTEPVIYQHFHTKEELYRAIIEAKASEVQAGDGKPQNRPEESDRDFFARMANLVLDRYERDPGYPRLLLYSALEGHELSDLFFDREVVEFYGKLTHYINRRIDAGKFRKMDATIAARAFAGMISNHGLVRLLFKDKIVTADRKAIVDQMIDIFLGGIRA